MQHNRLNGCAMLVLLSVLISASVTHACSDIRLAVKGQRHRFPTQIKLPAAKIKRIDSVIKCAQACARLSGRCLGFSFNTEQRSCLLSWENCGSVSDEDWNTYQSK